MIARRFIGTLVALCLVTLTSPASGQMVFRQGGHGEADMDVMVIQELGIVAGVEEGAEEIRVLVLLPGTEHEVEIQEGDLLLMANGKRVRDIAALREQYEGATVGEEVKLGFRRGDQRFLASFEKEDPMQHGGTRMVMVGSPGHEMGDMQPLLEFGVLLTEKDGEVVVAMKMPTDDAVFDEDDVVRSINGQKVGSLDDFRAIYESVAVGDDIALVVLRGDEEVDATRAKSEAQARVRIGGGR